MTQQTATAGKAPDRPAPSAASERFGGIALWLAVFVLLPNLPFVAARAFLTFNQAPFAVFYCLIGTFVGLMGWPVVAIVLMLSMLGFNLLMLIVEMFGLDIVDTLEHADLVFELNPFADPTYLAGFLVFGACFGTAFWLIATRFRRLGRVSPRLGAIMVFALPVPLSIASGKPHGLAGEVSHWAGSLMGTERAGDRPITSAVTASGFASPEALARRHNMMLVIVEAMGAFQDHAADTTVFAALADPALNEIFEVTRGTVPYNGSTTAAEMRELCGVSAPYRMLRDGTMAGTGCLPARLAAQGYRTSALHGMTENFFERDQWWSRTGLQQAQFREQLETDPALASCGEVFKGICDHDVAGLAVARLKAADAPQFVYWLTLNSHIPVSQSVTQALGCDRDFAPFATDRVCTLARMWRGVIADLVKGATTPGLPPSDILIVGDHAPPMFLPRDRGQFVPGVVPWVLLRHR